MAFLDNSGDIILDAVLTDIGRKKMATGNFRIVKFALGDDEIDYSLYVTNTGSAYQDLEILQTPIFEAFTQSNANINYGLLSLPRTDILYLPELKTNEKVASSVKVTGSVYYLAVNSETSAKLTTVFSDNRDYRLQSGQTSETYIVIESGLNTTDINGTIANRNSYLVNTNLLDRGYNVQVDNRFLAGVFGPREDGRFQNNSEGAAQINLSPLVTRGGGGSSTTLSNYNTYAITGIPNLVSYFGTATPDTNISNLNGPRGTVTALNFTADGALVATSTGTRSTKYNLYGNIDQKLFNATDKYDYIDTTVYVVGNTTTATTQLPVRIIRYAGT